MSALARARWIWLRWPQPKAPPYVEVGSKGHFRLIRDSEIEIMEEAEDLVRHFESALKQRRRGTVIRLKVNAEMPDDLLAFVIDELGADRADVFPLDGGLMAVILPGEVTAVTLEYRSPVVTGATFLAWVVLVCGVLAAAAGARRASYHSALQ